MSVAKSIEDCQKLAESKNGKCLSVIYENNYTDLLWQCSFGHQWSVMFRSIQNGNWCSECSGLNKKTIENCHKLAQLNNGKCLSINYKNSKADLVWECDQGHHWPAHYNSIQQGSWCPDLECKIEKTKQTCIEKYGCENPIQNKEIREKIKQTNIKKYGVDNPTKNKEIRLKAAKSVNNIRSVVYWETNEIFDLEGWEDLTAEYWNKQKTKYIPLP